MGNNIDQPEIFTIKATRCKRCGGILLSEFGLKNGMGHVCKRKTDQEAAAAQIDENQYTLFDFEDVQKRGKDIGETMDKTRN